MSQECLFCQIIAGQLPTNKVWEDDDFIAINDIHPKAPVHVLVIPKQHVATWHDLDESLQPISAKLVNVVQLVAEKTGIQDAYKVQVNVGQRAGQVVFHLHIHLLGGWQQPQTE